MLSCSQSTCGTAHGTRRVPLKKWSLSKAICSGRKEHERPRRPAGSGSRSVRMPPGKMRRAADRHLGRGSGRVQPPGLRRGPHGRHRPAGAGFQGQPLYLYFPTKKALFQGVIEEASEHKQALLRDTSVSPRDKLLRMYAPLITGGPDSSLRRCVRLAFSEGLDDPELMGGFYESFLAPNTARLREEFCRGLSTCTPPWTAFPCC